LAEVDPIIGLDRTPVIFTDGFLGASLTTGVVKLNFFSVGFDPVEQKNFRRGAVVLAIPLPGLLQTRDALDKIIAEFQAKGAFQMVPEDSKGNKND
jgi:hypothetical protein